MKTLFLSTAVSVLLLSTATAQIRGSINTTAPKVTSSISFASGGSVELEYTSINWGKGDWAKNYTTEQINSAAERRPIGALNITGTAVKLGGKDLAPGKYKLMFNKSGRKDWALVVFDPANAAKRVTWQLPLKKVKALSQRMRIDLQAGDGDDGLQCHIAFGKMACTVTGETKNGPTTGTRPTTRPHR